MSGYLEMNECNDTTEGLKLDSCRERIKVSKSGDLKYLLEKIDELEEKYKKVEQAYINLEIDKTKQVNKIEELEECIFEGAQTNLSILKCEEKFKELEKEIVELKRFQDITHQQYRKIISDRRPHKCPVCKGNKLKKRENERDLVQSCQKKLKECDCKGDCTDCRIMMEIIIGECDVCEGDGIVWG